MHIGLPKEIKVKENRVALTPGGVATLVRRGHSVTVERGAGVGSGIQDTEYEAVGARMGSAAEAWAAEMVVKVKEPIASEYGFLRDDLLLFTYLHLAADRPLTEALMQSGTTGVAYETVQLEDGSLPLLTPMSEVAGRLSVQAGAYHLQKPVGGRGVLLGGVPGVQAGHVVILGGGVVGTNAAKMAMGLGAKVTILDVSHRRLAYLDDVFFGKLTTMMSSEANIRTLLPETDLLIGGVLIPGAKAPHLITRDMLPLMQEGSVIVDVAVDQGGCVETIHATTHDDPTYVIDGVVHYGVANMPGAVPRTSTFALTNATFPYVLMLADQGLNALKTNKALRLGLNTHQGKLTYAGVGEAFEMSVVDAGAALA
ncbi:alanine dehydrogenase [Deinococcus deserti]|uniref:Alanine dehydrogenase n=1 Tax=Deinococcus deserti (strain DSM 17065 / CIP 109153 / LMG 22923 / VCD115) TaxID=546414 RepID=C1CX72_DEIDV|nr:alanine dehydrogenase [Deinococcus deserti]ACO46789.1 putative alanine dehydrogenase (Alanine dehydrogenase 2) [Deinococcus deserti VCD115]